MSSNPEVFSFEVIVLPTSAAFRCDLDVSIPRRYQVSLVSDVGLYLKEYKRSGKVDAADLWELKFTWKFDQIVKYGCPKPRVFTFHAGRRSSTGEGEFHLQTNTDHEANELLSRMQFWTKRNSSSSGALPSLVRGTSVDISLSGPTQVSHFVERRYTADNATVRAFPVYAKVKKKSFDSSETFCNKEDEQRDSNVFQRDSSADSAKLFPNDGDRKRTTSWGEQNRKANKLQSCQSAASFQLSGTAASDSSHHRPSVQFDASRSALPARNRSISQSSPPLPPPTSFSPPEREMPTLAVYDVIVLPTNSAVRCQLETGKADKYRLHFVDSGIVFKEKLNSEQNQSWRQIYHLRYDYIRRYGKRTNVFIIEAGRSCETGEGEFRFQSCEADKMFNLFRSTTEDILNRQQHKTEVNRSSPSENCSPSIGKADDNDSILNIAKDIQSEIHSCSLDMPTNGVPSPALSPFSVPVSPQTSELVTKDDSHIYAQVQKKRMAPNIPPRGTSLRKPHSSANVLNKLQQSLTSDSKDVVVPPAPPRQTVTFSTEKREPIYAELLHVNHTTVSCNGNKFRPAKARCRSPAPLTDNFIRMDGVTQYASVVDFVHLQPETKGESTDMGKQGRKSSNQNQISADMDVKSAHQTNLNNGNVTANEHITNQPPSSSTSHKKKPKTKSKGKSPLEKKNDENKQTSWFSFFSSGSKKPGSS